MNGNNAKKTPYIITVEYFKGSLKYVPLQGTKAYSYPMAGSAVVYVFPAATSSTMYFPHSLVFCDGDYWACYTNLTGNGVDGYVNCSDIKLDIAKYAAPDKQIPNSQIGSNTNVIFNMWYFPVSSYTGVKYAIPLYYQKYYVSGSSKPINSLKCTLLSSISGDYLYEGKYDDPTTYLNNMTKKYWSDSDGATWIATMARTSTQTSIMAKAKSNLDSHKPFLVGAQARDAEKTPHMVLVTGYKNSGTNLSDYIVLDSSQKYFSNLDAFFKSFPDKVDGTTWKTIGGGTNYVYGEY